MPEVMYGGRQGERLRLEVDPDLVAVRTRSRRSFRDGPVPGPEAAVLDAMELVLEFPEVGVEVYRRRGGADRSVAEVKEALEQAPDTRFAGNVLVDPAGQPVLYTENLFVKFRNDRPVEDCRRALLEAGLRVKDELPYATNAFFAAAPEGSGRRSSPSPSGCWSATTSSTPTPSWSASWAAGPSSPSSGTWPRPRSAARASAPARTWPRPTPSPRARRSPWPSSTPGSTSTTRSSPVPARSWPRTTPAAATTTRGPCRGRTTAPPAPAWPAPTAWPGPPGSPQGPG